MTETEPDQPAATLDTEIRAYVHEWHAYMNADEAGQWAYTDALNVVEDNLDVVIERADAAGVAVTEEEAAAWVQRERKLQRKRARRP